MMPRGFTWKHAATLEVFPVRYAVTVIGETATRYRVRLEESAVLPKRGRYDRGAVVLVPQSWVTFPAGGAS